MFDLVPLERKHVESVLASPINREARKFLRAEHIARIAYGPCAVAAIVKGEVMAVGGVDHMWDHRGGVWALFSHKSEMCFLPVFRAVKKWLDMLPYDRLDLDVPYGDEKALRRAKLWGFKVEAERAQKFGPGGEDCTLLARVK